MTLRDNFMPGRLSLSDGRPSAAPLRVRATIVIDIEADDPVALERATNEIVVQHQILSRSLPRAELAFRKRKPRTRPRAVAPVRIAPYVDD